MTIVSALSAAPAALSIAREAATQVAPGFGEMIEKMASQTIQSLRAAESVSVDGVMEKAPVQQVVNQVMEAERVLQVSIALRDKFVAAIQEVGRMQI